eukprot:TRINITY_DN19081_c0_g1_i1.p1 TRINITY_DN19081_c0_g1~~TRINITY_DN19081_c0_g1_i1.p1  ORF type:complete len:181 (-),score=25.81 TRINITY_DN19081_c0_g1_i1:1-468(-)
MANRVDELLSTRCIRKDYLQPNPDVRRKFPANAPEVKNEHFVELQAVVRCHHHEYKKKTFSSGVSSLLKLRDHFNLPKNIYRTSKDINNEKAELTRIYFKEGGFKNAKNPSAGLRNYIVAIAPIALKHIDDVTEVREGVKIALDSYVRAMLEFVQ